jgi:hypothetical protein
MPGSLRAAQTEDYRPALSLEVAPPTLLFSQGHADGYVVTPPPIEDGGAETATRASPRIGDDHHVPVDEPSPARRCGKRDDDSVHTLVDRREHISDCHPGSLRRDGPRSQVPLVHVHDRPVGSTFPVGEAHAFVESAGNDICLTRAEIDPVRAPLTRLTEGGLHEGAP